MRKAWPVCLLAAALVVACTTSPVPSDPLGASAMADATEQPPAGLTVAMLREAELQRQKPAVARQGDDVMQDLAPSTGDIVGFGGSVLGDIAAGLPGGAVLGFSGQVAGGNKAGKAVGSTVGALLGSLLGPVGGLVGSVVGGYAGNQADNANEPRVDDFGAVYIEGMDTGPLIATPIGNALRDPNKT